jgi:hypothetical protein
VGKEVRKEVAYLRTSNRTNVGADKDSDKRQRPAIEAYAKRVGYKIVEEFYDAAMSGADAIRDGFDCLAVIVHHCPHDANRPRGHSSLVGALDIQIAVRRDIANNVVAELSWPRTERSASLFYRSSNGSNSVTIRRRPDHLMRRRRG